MANGLEALSKASAISQSNPSIRNRLANVFLDGSLGREKLVSGFLGTQGVGLADFTPLGALFAFDEMNRARQRNNLLEAGVLATSLLPLPAAKLARPVKNKLLDNALAMDQKSRASRASEQGFSDEVFFRGEATGKTVDEFPGGGFFSRDRDTAAGFAKRGGKNQPNEFRLNLENTFVDSKPVTSTDYSRLVTSASEVDPKLADDMVDLIAPGKSVGWFAEFVKRNPETVVSENGAFIRALIENSRAPELIFRKAGFDSIDVGRDVRKLTGSGIRSTQAAFDPSKKASRNIFHAVPLGGLGVAGLLDQSDEF